MAAAVIVDVGAVIDRSRFSARQIAIIALCGLLMVLDGYDSGEIAFVGPSLLREWHLQPSMLTLLFTVNGITQIIAALCFGPLTDRYGRRWIMIGGTALTGAASFASAYAFGPDDFLVWRIICALGLAGVMTNAIALGAEYAPVRARSFSVIALYCGFAVGQTIGAGVAAQVIPTDGWRLVMIIGGVLPVAFAALCVFILPEFDTLPRAAAAGQSGDRTRVAQDRPRFALRCCDPFHQHRVGRDRAADPRAFRRWSRRLDLAGLAGVPHEHHRAHLPQ